MSDDVPESASLSRLRNAWLESTDARDERACLAPGWIWDAVDGLHSPEELQRGLDHVAQCGACAEAWRVAHEIATLDAQAGSRASGSPQRGAWTSWKVWLPAAAALVVFLGGTGYDRGWFERAALPSSDPVMRGATPALASAMGDATACDRAACRIAWTDAGAGARYAVRITSPDLELLTSANGLAQPGYDIPPATLRTLGAGSEVFWQVDAVLPDGRRLSSPTFVLMVR